MLLKELSKLLEESNDEMSIDLDIYDFKNNDREDNSGEDEIARQLAKNHGVKVVSKNGSSYPAYYAFAGSEKALRALYHEYVHMNSSTRRYDTAKDFDYLFMDKKDSDPSYDGVVAFEKLNSYLNSAFDIMNSAEWKKYVEQTEERFDIPAEDLNNKLYAQIQKAIYSSDNFNSLMQDAK